MNIKICNPEEDSYGNKKENVFLAFNEEGSYIGCSWVYPVIKYHEIHETPYTIFIQIDMEENLENGLESQAKQMLFHKAFSRAKELRMERPDLKTRVYSAFLYNEDMMNFYLKNGFEEDYSIVMEADIPKNFTYNLPQNIEVTEVKIDSDEKFMEYKDKVDEIFITPIDREEFKEQQKQKHFKILTLSIDGKLQGGCTVFEEDGLGIVETLYVVPEARRTGISKIIVNYIFDYFASNGLYKTQLVVWELNKRGVKLYESFGYKEVKKKITSPGITL